MAVWISAGSFLVVLVTIVWRDGLFRGRVLAVLERLTDMTEDHEDRLRDQEKVSNLYVAQVPVRRPGARERAAARRPRPPSAG